MPRWLTVIAVLAALVLLSASATMNYLFASSLGRSPHEAIVLGVVSVGIDVLKAVVAVALGYAARERRWGFFCVGSLAFALFTALSLTTALGFTASNRGAVTGERERHTNRLANIETRIAELRSALKALPAHRPLAIVEEALAVAHVDARWTASRQCTAAQSAARQFCAEVGQLRTERAAGLEARRIETLIIAQETEAERLRGAGFGLSSDPQARALARAIGLDEVQVQRGLMALLALVVEVASGFGVYLALGGGIGGRKDTRPAPPTETSPIGAVTPTLPEPAGTVESQPSIPAAPAPIAPAAETLRPSVTVGIRPTPRPTRRNGANANDGGAARPVARSRE